MEIPGVTLVTPDERFVYTILTKDSLIKNKLKKAK